MVNYPSHNHLLSFNLCNQQKLTGLLLCIAIVNFKAGLVHSVPLAIEAPAVDIGNNSLALVDPIRPSGCRYKATLYAAGEDVPTDEPCLLCQCKNTATVCKLRICPDIPIPPPPGCIVVHKAKKCCSQLICPENNRKYSREQRLPMSNASLISAADAASPGKGYCLLDGTVYAEGSAMRSSTLCQYCFCIRGEMKCSSPQCVIPLNGCKPRFRSYACCPTNYDCNESNGTAILKNIPSSTPIPQFLKGCQVNGRFVAEGEPVAPMQLAVAAGPDINSNNACQTCFCMGGVVRCRPLECDRPIAGCRAVTEDGHCCPDRYDCDEIHSPLSPASSPNPDEMPFSTSRSILPVDNFESLKTVAVGVTQITPENEPATTLPTLEASPTKSGKAKSRSKSNMDYKRKNHGTAAGISTRNRSDAGSREERRNKDRDDYSSRTFYDDDEKDEDMSSLSFEHGTNYKHSSLSFEETTDQSDSNSEMEPELGETETESSPTEETIGTGVYVTDPENEIVPSTSPADSVTSSPMKNLDSVEKGGETVMGTGITEEPAASFREEDENESSTSASQTIKSPPRQPQTISSTLEKIKEILVAADPEIAASNLGSLSQAESLSTTTTKTTTTTAKTPNETTTTVETEKPHLISTTTVTSTSGKATAEETTVSNVMFIPFGVEDAVRNPVNDSAGSLEPVLLTIPSYDSHAVIKSSLIPPTPPKGYQKSKTRNKVTDQNSTGNNEVPEREIVAPVVKDDFRNAIMDVPISTSLYNNGYYRQGSIADENTTDLTIGHSPLDLQLATYKKDNNSKDSNKIASANGFHGHVFEESDSVNFGIGEAIAEPTSLYEESHVTTPAKTPEKTHTVQVAQNFIPSFGSVPVPSHPPRNNATHGKPSENPARTYSKFGMQDSTYYRYNYGNTNGQGNGQKPIPSQPDHHRYYNQPEVVQPVRKTPPNLYAHRNSANTFNKPHNPFSDFESYDDDKEGIGEEDSYESYQPKNTRNRLGVGTVNINASPSSMIPAGGSSSSKTPTSGGNSNSNKTHSKRPTVAAEEFTNPSGVAGFKPVVAFPFTIQKKPTDSSFHLGLKLSGCNIYGKMYRVGSIINELSSPCVQCRCTDVGVQCSELPC